MHLEDCLYQPIHPLKVKSLLTYLLTYLLTCDAEHSVYTIYSDTVNSEIFDTLFSQMALKDIGLFATFKIRDKGMIYLYISQRQSDLAISRGFIFSKLLIAYAKFRENKVLAKISEFTVCAIKGLYEEDK